MPAAVPDFNVPNRGQNVLGTVEESPTRTPSKKRERSCAMDSFLRNFQTRDTNQCQPRLLRSDDVCNIKI
jgi:hypothetical protein